MKETIKSEIDVNIQHEELLDDNTLLQFVEDTESKFSTSKQVRVRYISHDSIAEDIIGNFDFEGALIHKEANSKFYYGKDRNILVVNGQAIAYFSEDIIRDMRYLIGLYDIKRHEFVENDFKRTMYDKFFAQTPDMKKNIKK